MIRTVSDEERLDRQALVNAAERVIRSARETREGLPRELKTQLSQLIAVCQSAACQGEIENYLQYQIGRNCFGTRDFGDAVLREAKGEIDSLSDKSPATAVEAWARFSTYLKRAYVYYAAVREGQRAPGGREPGAAPRQNNPADPQGQRRQERRGPAPEGRRR
jgi:hypothetical protein